MEHKVGISQMKVSKNPEDLIITYSLGSCIGISIYDDITKIGGMLHFQLPDSKAIFNSNGKSLFMFADTAIPAFFQEAYKLGATKKQLKVVIAGGSKTMDTKGYFDIGKRNILATKKIFFNNDIITKYYDVGGQNFRTMKLFIRTGSTHIITPTCKTEVNL